MVDIICYQNVKASGPTVKRAAILTSPFFSLQQVRYSFRRRSSRQKSILAATSRNSVKESEGGRTKSIRYGRTLKPSGRSPYVPYEHSTAALDPLTCHLGEDMNHIDENGIESEEDTGATEMEIEEDRKRRCKHHLNSNGRKNSWSMNDISLQRNHCGLSDHPSLPLSRPRTPLPQEDGLTVPVSPKSIQTHHYNGISLLDPDLPPRETDTQL